MSETTVSVIVPVYNEAGNLDATLTMLRHALQAGDELVVVDGGSTDNSVEIARELADRVVLSAPGRARQMNAGARQARGDWLWFVHADSQLLKQEQGRPHCLRPVLTTSSRRWESRGAWPTIWLMWSLRYRYWRGAQPEQLYRDYYGEH